MNQTVSDRLLHAIETRAAVVGIIGLGYVGLPLALAFARASFKVVGFDTDPVKIQALNQGHSYIHHIDPARIREAVERGSFQATGDFAKLAEADAILICVPTP